MEMVWRKPTNQSELTPGTRIRYVGFRDGLIKHDEAETLKKLLKENRNAEDIVARVNSAEWKYGTISDSGKYINTDGKGVFHIPKLHMVEIHAKEKTKWSISFSSSRAGA